METRKMKTRYKYPLRQVNPKHILLAWPTTLHRRKWNKKRNIHISMTKLEVDFGGPLQLATLWRNGFFRYLWFYFKWIDYSNMSLLFPQNPFIISDKKKVNFPKTLKVFLGLTLKLLFGCHYILIYTQSYGAVNTSSSIYMPHMLLFLVLS